MIAATMQIKPSPLALNRAVLAQPASRSITLPLIGARRSFAPVRAGKDFDAVLMDVANKFEKADNKVPIVAWTAAAFFAITTAEWFIHLPLFDFLIGFPIQFLGLITAANYGLKYYKGERIDLVDEFEGLVNKVSKELPGIGK